MESSGFSKWLFAVVVTASSCSAFASSELADSIELLNDIERTSDSYEEMVSALNTQFERIQVEAGQSPIQEVSDHDLSAYFAAANRISFYSKGESTAKQMRQIFDELQRRQLATPAMRQQMLDGYSGARMLDDARYFAADPANEGLKQLPTFRDQSSPTQSPTLWRVQDAGKALVRHDIDLTERPILLVLGPPGCGFSRQAAEDISKDGDLFELMARHSIWLMPQSSIPDISELNAWSTSQPGWSKELIHLDSEWPFIDTAMPPGFYFLKDGKVISLVQGWPGPEQLAELREGFKKIGIQSASANNSRVDEVLTKESIHP